MPSALAERLSVLLVDDDSQLLRTLSDILRRRGYSPVTALTGREGLSLAEHSPTPMAVALVDLRLPDMDGLEVIAHLRRVSGLTETVVLTGHASLDTAVRALREQSCDYLVKPVAPDQLMPIVDRAGERWHRRLAEEALRQSEERYRLLLENISDVIAVGERDQTVRYVSPSITRVLGYPPEMLVGRRGLLDVHPDDAAAADRFVGEALAAPGAAGSLEVRARHHDGSWRLIELSGTNLTDRPEIGGIVYVGRDVTERRRFEAQVQQSQKMESIGSLAGGVAHDFNNVLSAIIGYGEMVLSDAVLDDAVRADVDEILKAAHRAGALTRQLLAFSRRQPVEPHVFSVNGLVDDMLKMLRRLISENIRLRTELAPDLWTVRADLSQMEQVLMNLTINARDAMPDGGALTIVTTNERADEKTDPELQAGAYVRLTVRDTGVGMTDDVKARAFEPFFTTKEAGRGTGLGLATCYGIVKQAGGHIVIDSAPRQGTSVSVYLPRSKAPADVRSRTSPVSNVQGRDERVLVVDDEPAIRTLMARMLGARGYQTFEAADADQALAIIRERRGAIDLLLTDVILPGMTGLKLAEVLTAEFPAVKVLFMSGYDEPAARVVGASPSAWALIQKPFDPPALLRKVRSVLDAAIP